MLHNQITSERTSTKPDLLGVQAERYLAERAERTLKRKSQSKELVYEFTRDEGLLHQYYLLRSQMLQRALGVMVEPIRDEYDDYSQILVVRKGRQVVAGARMVVCSPRTNRPLAIEVDGFRVRDALPHLNLENEKYCEFSRFVVLEEFQHGDIVAEMFKRLSSRFEAMGVRYGFSAAPSIMMRIHRKICSQQGYRYTKLPEVQLPERPEYESQKLTLVMFELPENSPAKPGGEVSFQSTEKIVEPEE
jgi:hypothetical protein